MALSKIEIRKKNIIDTATKVFSQRGFQEATITEIAKEAKVSEASIYEYFSTKEGLLFSIPAESSQTLFDLMAFHLKLIRGAANKLRAIVFLFMDSYQNSPDFAAVLMLFLKHNKKFLDTKGHHAIKEGIKQITQVIEEGIAANEFRSDLYYRINTGQIQLPTFPQYLTKTQALPQLTRPRARTEDGGCCSTWWFTGGDLRGYCAAAGTGRDFHGR